ncbi:hypothetical protein [Dysgonomonas sp. 520]|uniref:hypothetical protein n=1 Tax=Dysgonomonas sp. 520 TaxID=2302931 RepID=UPI0013D47ACE|nr:hypothetical protein [Dysgonomonas sp. 520]NDW08689.1 hypothetical protein [Dysgonomonas sp. 520]
MKKKILIAIMIICAITPLAAQDAEYKISLKSPGNLAETFSLYETTDGSLKASKDLPVDIRRKNAIESTISTEEITITARETVYFSFEEILKLGFSHNDCQFYMPGFWYRRNLRSPKEAPSFHTSDSWQVREDRLSVPLAGAFNGKTGEFYTVLRMDNEGEECLTTHKDGEVILSGRTSLGYTGFRNINGTSALVFGFPYSEAPKTYIRKLTLSPAIQTFMKLDKGESITLKWDLRKGKAEDFSGFVANVWNYSFDILNPQKTESKYTAEQAKEILSNFFKESYVDKYDLKYYSGVHMRTDDCANNGSAEIGFVGRILLNAFNALEYGEANNRTDLIADARSIFDSYLNHGFTSAGFLREFVDLKNNEEPDLYSIRRQSEGVFAILNYLDYERKKGRIHKDWEEKVKHLLNNFAKLQNADGSFPRKFNNKFEITDSSGGSTPSATLPLTMAYGYFKDKHYLDNARKTAVYLEKELISKSDYFSSTLDANCEDKEASLYASTAMYYLSFVTKGKEREHYINLCKKAAYFSLSWYYMWDVPFAQGQMLGDVGFKSRGWGNVSVENNHIDVFIFEFATILDWLAKECNEPRFSSFSSVIKSSMLQLMPVKGHMFDIGKVGYYPEVVQHTNWDYGKNGKGFYNDIFAPGWTVASLWQMLSPNRVENYFNKKQRK